MTLKEKSRVNAIHESTTDPGARLVCKSDGDASRLCYMGHVLMENRNGLVVDVSVSAATGAQPSGKNRSSCCKLMSNQEPQQEKIAAMILMHISRQYKSRA
ncbi:hypothetical protein [Nitrosomonas sp. Nm132]|uniref:hypothetical protein n=1 Tax=Nitrosomonas sp. Nm132 TaxID=1881053 RepID=UPI000B8A2200|nr:hypothetical protein [Nitrosomonas sp. Nm132]